MKRAVVLSFVSIVISGCVIALPGCGSNDGKTSTDTGGDLTKNPVYQKGVQLVGDNKCMICHQIDAPLTGPAYREVANRYASMPDTIVPHLARKIISGGKGEWGEIYMTPHPDVSQADAEAMVKYILLLKK